MTTTLDRVPSSDYYLMDELLTDEARAVRDRVRGFVEQDVLRSSTATGTAPSSRSSWCRKIGPAGIIGATIEGSHGSPASPGWRRHGHS